MTEERAIQKDGRLYLLVYFRSWYVIYVHMTYKIKVGGDDEYNKMIKSHKNS